MPKKKTKKKTAKKKVGKKVAVESYRHESATRKNIPTAKIAAEGIVPRVDKARYSYSAHLSPELRFDASGQSDRVSEIVEKAAAGNKLTKEEADILRGVAATAGQPWLEWSGKREEHDRGVLEVEPVALHIHERVSANAIVRAAKREDIQADLFADPKQEYKEAVQFYKHDVDWANRLILGDSLEAMSSLAKREGMAGKVQMIYMDPPYGIRYSSNFQPQIGNKTVESKAKDLTRELEMVKAYRDTWSLGVHSYLSYLRDRIMVSRELLADSGSVFVQISSENLHSVTQILDDVFGSRNRAGVITFVKTGGFGSSQLLKSVADYILWYTKDTDSAKIRMLYKRKNLGDEGTAKYRSIELPSGERMPLSAYQENGGSVSDRDGKVFREDNVTSQGNPIRSFEFEGKKYSQGWKTNEVGLARLSVANRLSGSPKTLSYIRYINDFPAIQLTNVWDDIGGIQSRSDPKVYVVQTATKAIQRCMLLTTDPGDLVLDPTCGSGTTAHVAEEWGRRWITMDSSRVALSVARQRLLTSTFSAFMLRGSGEGEKSAVDPSENFVYSTVPHITLGSIAQNDNLDAVVDSYKSALDSKLVLVNESISGLSDDIRTLLVEKLASKLQDRGARAVTDSDRRRWLLPGTKRQQISSAFATRPKLSEKQVGHYFDSVPADGGFEHWNVPFDVDEDWPLELRNYLEEYREEWASMAGSINECISANSEQEELFDQPKRVDGVLRVSGPFTVEGVRPEELSLDESGELFDPTPNEWEVNDGQGGYSQNASAYLDRMLLLLSQDGVTFPNNEHKKFSLIERLEESGSVLHAEALWEGAGAGDVPNVAIAFGPQHGPVTASQVEDLVRASRRYDELVIAAFSFDGSSQAVIQESANPRLKIHMVHIRPDVSPGMDGLLKDSPKSQLFTVFGQPEIKLYGEDGEIKVELLGVDIYSPLTGEITSSGANKVAAWFLDSDYDGRCFCITQAFFPNQKAWDKIAKALGSSADAEAFDAYNGTVSVPFEPGEHQRIAVKVIDPRGNEVMAIRSLNGDNDHA